MSKVRKRVNAAMRLCGRAFLNVNTDLPRHRKLEIFQARRDKYVAKRLLQKDKAFLGTF